MSNVRPLLSHGEQSRDEEDMTISPAISRVSSLHLRSEKSTPLSSLKPYHGSSSGSSMSKDNAWNNGDKQHEQVHVQELPSSPGRIESTAEFNFKPKKQFWSLLISGALRWLITLTLAILLGTTIWQYSKKQVMTEVAKRWFNAITTGLSLSLGISIASGFKSMAVDMRWFILSRRRRSLHDVDLILRADSLTAIAKLLLSSARFDFRHRPQRWNWRLILGCFTWLVFNIAFQVSVALIALTYSPNTGDSIALLSPGHVTVANMTQIFPQSLPKGSKTSLEAAQRYTANSLGIEALGFDLGYYPPPPPGRFWNTGATLFSGTSDTDLYSLEFVFFDSAPDQIGGLSSVYTNRTINSTGSCSSSYVTTGGDGSTTSIGIRESGSSKETAVTLPVASGLNQTTFFTTPNATCGDGCSIVEAFEASSTYPWYYSCNITVGPVVNAIHPEHKVSLKFRNMAANAIALQGSSPQSNSNQTEYQVYPSQSPYGQPCGGSTDDMGWLISIFAIGVVAAQAQYPSDNVATLPGLQPSIGNVLTVTHWVYLLIILGSLVAIQGIAFVTTAFVANQVIVKKENVFSTARLLRPFVNRLGEHGTSAEGVDICKMIDEDPDSKVIYTAVRTEEDGDLLRLELGHGRKLRAFPGGRYD